MRERVDATNFVANQCIDVLAWNMDYVYFFGL